MPYTLPRRALTSLSGPELSRDSSATVESPTARGDRRPQRLQTAAATKVVGIGPERRAWMDTLSGIAVMLVILLHASEGLPGTQRTRRA